MQAISHLFARWNALPRAIRLIASAGAPILAIGIITATLLVHPARTPLFPTPLHPEQLAEVEERLAAWNVPFIPTADNVTVDSGRRNDLLLRLSLAGAPHLHLSSTEEALGSIGVLTPQAVVEAQTRAGLAGDIEAGLRGIDGVDDARAIVVPAKGPEFADQSSQAASASVRLRLRARSTLSRATVDGIRAFVAASVPGLEPARVTILDDRGVALGDDTANGDDAAFLQQTLQSALDAAFGAGSTIVRVRAEYDAGQTTQRDIRRAPVGAQAIERMRRSESYDGAGKRYRHLEVGEGRGSETHERIAQVPPGVLKRLSAAIFIDQGRSLDLPKVRELASAALGYDARRGDTLAVESVEFHHEAVARKDAWWLIYGTIVPLAPPLVIAIGIVFGVRLAVPPLATIAQSLVDRALVDRTSKAVAGYAPARVRSLLEQEPPHSAAAIISALPAVTATAVLELYPPHEREEIVRRMQRRHSPLLDDPHELLRRHVG